MSAPDARDRRLLAILQSEARLSVKALARRTGDSPEAVASRMTRLEAQGVIRRYRAVLDPASLGVAIRAFVFVRRSRDSDRDAVLAAILALPEVVGCHVVSGEYDFLVELLARDMHHYADATLSRLAAIPGLLDHRTTFAITSLRSEGDVPLTEAEPNDDGN